MKKTALVTFGCSWTYGIGVWYEPGMSYDELKTDWHKRRDGDEFSFRALLSKKYGLHNINLSEGGASNQKQFRAVKEFFAGNSIQQLFDQYENIIVLHGITSTARNEMFVNELNEIRNFMYTEDTTWAKTMVKFFYNHDYEVDCLNKEMNFFDTFYSLAGIKNLWFDTFNHHNYSQTSNNLIGKNDSKRDLLSKMALISGLEEPDDQYHTSHFIKDTNRIEILVNTGHLNPYTYHPTKKGHQLIANILDQHIRLQIFLNQPTKGNLT
jgi:hypothetical protein